MTSETPVPTPAAAQEVAAVAAAVTAPEVTITATPASGGELTVTTAAPPNPVATTIATAAVAPAAEPQPTAAPVPAQTAAAEPQVAATAASVPATTPSPAAEPQVAATTAPAPASAPSPATPVVAVTIAASDLAPAQAPVPNPAQTPEQALPATTAKSTSRSPYKLIYFPLKGRAEVSRILFLLGGQEFEDEHVPLEKWADRKSQTAFLQLPQLDIRCLCEPVNTNEPSVSIAQSSAIERYLANKFNLAGRNAVETAKVDMIVEQVNDLVNGLIDVHKLPDSDDKKQKLDKAYKETAPSNLKLLAKLYDQNQKVNENSGFLVGRELTYADVKLVNAYDWLRESKDGVLGEVPQLKQHYEKVRGLPKLKDHYAKSDKLKLAPFFKD